MDNQSSHITLIRIVVFWGIVTLILAILALKLENNVSLAITYIIVSVILFVIACCIIKCMNGQNNITNNEINGDIPNEVVYDALTL